MRRRMEKERVCVMEMGGMRMVLEWTRRERREMMLMMKKKKKKKKKKAIDATTTTTTMVTAQDEVWEQEQEQEQGQAQAREHRDQHPRTPSPLHRPPAGSRCGEPMPSPTMQESPLTRLF